MYKVTMKDFNDDHHCFVCGKENLLGLKIEFHENQPGKEVAADTGNTVTVSGNSTELTYSLGADAKSVTISILDANGKVVKRLTEGEQQAGTNKVTWDSSGVDIGNYTFDWFGNYSSCEEAKINCSRPESLVHISARLTVPRKLVCRVS